MIVNETYYPLTTSYKTRGKKYKEPLNFRTPKVLVQNPDGVLGTNLVLESVLIEENLYVLDFRFAASEFSTSCSYKVQAQHGEVWVNLGPFNVFQVSNGRFRISLNTEDWEAVTHRLVLRIWFRLGQKIKYQEYYVSLEEE